jgi:U3 small nucleolar RNA-associated protein 14
VKDFEASIRGPIGNTWIPETAHHALIKPPVVTKLGTIIKPMDEDILVKKKKKIKGMP